MVSTDLRHPNLRHRDIKRVLAHVRYGIRWDAGTNTGSEWVYASLEDAVHKQQLSDWLCSKSISEHADALMLGGGYEDCTSIVWEDILRDLKRFFDKRKILVVSKDLEWIIEYEQMGVARFGRWPNAM